MQEYGERFKDQDLVEKVMRTLTPRFDGRVAAVEEARDLSEMKIEHLQASLEAHELKMNERSPARLQDQALYASKQKQGWKNKKWRGNARRYSNKHEGKNPSAQGKFDQNDYALEQSMSYGRKREACSGNKAGK